MADALDLLRQDALIKRLKNIGGNSIRWSAKDAALIADHIMTMPARMIRDAPTASRELVDAEEASARNRFSERGIVIRAATKPDDLNFLFVISSEVTDLAGDVVTVEGIDRTNFLRNPVVLNAHDSSALPIAVSTAPLVSGGKTLTAIARFPKPGVSERSEQVAAALRGGLVRGSSIGFVPLRWSFTKDPSRPFGVDFHEIRLLEWSVCAVPCNPACLLLGVVDGKSSSHSSSRNRPLDSDAKIAGRRSEARALAAKARSISASIADDSVLTREQRLAEAHNFRRVALGRE